MSITVVLQLCCLGTSVSSSLLSMASHDPKQVNFKTIPNPKTIEWPDNEHWHDDVPGNLDTFVRLSKAGLYSKANSFYHDLLKPHAANDFAIVAQYAETLIEQGAFKAAEDFLNDDLVSNSTFEGEERTVLQLLSANARMYTRFEWDQAAEVAAKAVRTVGEVLIKENMSPTQVRQIIPLHECLLIRDSCKSRSSAFASSVSCSETDRQMRVSSS